MLRHGFIAPTHTGAWVGAAPHTYAWGGFHSHSYKDWQWLTMFTGYTVQAHSLTCRNIQCWLLPPCWVSVPDWPAKQTTATYWIG
jgi:hypothetical protein